VDDANYFEAPRSPTGDSFERKLAFRLLEAREKGLTTGRHFRSNFKRYFILLVVFGLSIYYFYRIHLDPGVHAFLGALIGVLLRDFGFARSQMRTWPSFSKLLDWESVERMAAGEAIEPS
jgi:hypothetical protein